MKTVPKQNCYIVTTVAVELHPLNLKRFYDAYFRLG